MTTFILDTLMLAVVSGCLGSAAARVRPRLLGLVIVIAVSSWVANVMTRARNYDELRAALPAEAQP